MTLNPARIDPVLKAIQDCKSHIDVEFKDETLRHQMLGQLKRRFIIDKVKTPLYCAINLAAKLYPKATKRNTQYHNTHVLMDIFDRFFENFICDSRRELFESARTILLAEIEHDVVYAFILNYFAEEIAKEINNGNWLPNNKECPQPGIWRE